MDDWFTTKVTRPVITKPREDKDINPELLHRIKTYIGTTSLGTHANRASLLEAKGKNVGNFAIPKKTDTKIEITISILVVMGYTVKSIASNSEELFGVKLTMGNVRDAYKRVLFSKNKKYFLNRKMKENES